tara:strand:- start:339 stop:569 length:231 start_codon:yes stop_codon:yes gene_type:complete
MNINIENTNYNLDVIKLQKMAFLYNALEKGWNISKNKECYIFKKNHEGKKEIFLDDYLKHFLSENLELDNILKKNN